MEYLLFNSVLAGNALLLSYFMISWKKLETRFIIKFNRSDDHDFQNENVLRYVHFETLLMCESNVITTTHPFISIFRFKWRLCPILWVVNQTTAKHKREQHVIFGRNVLYFRKGWFRDVVTNPCSYLHQSLSVKGIKFAILPRAQSDWLSSVFRETPNLLQSLTFMRCVNCVSVFDRSHK